MKKITPGAFEIFIAVKILGRTSSVPALLYRFAVKGAKLDFSLGFF